MRRILALIVLASLLFPFAASAATCTSLTNNIQAYWKFDESSGNASDASANGNTATNNNATFSAGKIHNGVFGNGTSAYLQSFASTFFNPTGDFSFGGWFQSIVLPSGTGGFTYAFSENDVLLRLLNTGVMTLLIWTGAGHTLTAGTAISTGAWHQFVVTDSGGTVTMYLDGASTGTPLTGITVTWETPHQPMAFMTDSNNTTSTYEDDAFDEWGVWTCALSPAQVTTLFNDGNSGVQYPFTAKANFSPWQFSDF